MSSTTGTKRARPDGKVSVRDLPTATVKVLVRVGPDQESLCTLEFVPNPSELVLLDIYRCETINSGYLRPDYDRGANANYALTSYFVNKYEKDATWSATDPLLRSTIESLCEVDDEASSLLNELALRRGGSYYCHIETEGFDDSPRTVNQWISDYVEFLRKARNCSQNLGDLARAEEFLEKNPVWAKRIDSLKNEELGIGEDDEDE